MKISERTAITLSMRHLSGSKVDTRKIDDSFRTLKEEMSKIILEKAKKQTPSVQPYFVRDFFNSRTTINKSIDDLNLETRGSACLHKSCAGCKSGWCSGMHMISCPCRSCSPWC